METGNGSGTAAPTAAKILDYYFNEYNLAQSSDTQSSDTPATETQAERCAGDRQLISWRETRPFDYVLLLTAVALTAYGLLLIYSGSLTDTDGFVGVLKGPVGRQLAFAIVGVGACIVVSQMDYRFLARGSTVMYVGLILALLFVLTLGAAEFGSRRWIPIFGTQVQPSA